MVKVTMADGRVLDHPSADDFWVENNEHLKILSGKDERRRAIAEYVRGSWAIVAIEENNG